MKQLEAIEALISSVNKELANSYDNLNRKFNIINANYIKLQDKHIELCSKHNALCDQHNDLQNDYDNLEDACDGYSTSLKQEYIKYNNLQAKFKREYIKNDDLDEIAEFITADPFGKSEDIRQIQKSDCQGSAHASGNPEPESGEDNRQKVEFAKKDMAGNIEMIGTIMKDGDTNHHQGDCHNSACFFFSG